MNYCRVSSMSQKAAGSLDRQIERMRKFMGEQEVKEGEYLLVTDVASSFGSREGLNKVVDLVLSRSISVVYVEVVDRWSRMASERRLLEHLMEENGVKLVCATQTIEDPSEQSWLMTEMLDYLTVCCNRVSSSKAARVNRTQFKDEAGLIRRIEEFLSQGWGLYSVVQRLNDEGWTCNVKGEERPLNYSVVRKLLLARKTVRDTLVKPDIIGDFIRDTCIIGTGQVPVATLFNRYVQWCESRGLEPATKRSWAVRIRKDFKSQTIRLNSQQTCCGYVKLSLKPSDVERTDEVD